MIVIVMTMVIGTTMAALLNRFSSRAAHTYCIAAGVLVFASLTAPLFAAGTPEATKVTLIAARLIAAAVVVPLVSRCLDRTH